MFLDVFWFTETSNHFSSLYYNSFVTAVLIFEDFQLYYVPEGVLEFCKASWTRERGHQTSR